MARSNVQDFEKQRRGDIAYDYYHDNWDVLHIGSSGQGLVVSSGLPAWGYPAGLSIASQAQGDILYFDGTNWVRLAAGTAGYFLKTQGASANPAWTANDKTSLVDRTRYVTPLVPVVLVGGGAATPSIDVHGSLNGFPHLHFADGVDSGVYYGTINVPADDANLAASDWVLKALWSSSIGGNNIYVEPVVVGWSLAGGDTAGSVPLDTPAAVAADAAANKQKLTTWTFSSLPGAKALSIAILFTRTNVADTNTGQVSLYHAWVEYKADM